MELSDEDIVEFVDCWRRDFGEDISRELARLEAMRLLDFFAALAEVIAGPDAKRSEAEDGAILHP